MAQPAEDRRRGSWSRMSQHAPNDPVVQFNFGIALFCAGYVADAEQAFRQAKKAGRDTFYEMQADEILHPQFFQPQDGSIRSSSPSGRNTLLIQGVLLQRRGQQHSAEKLYARAARLQPGNDEAQVAAAVGRFDEDNLSASFSRLGPLVKRFPHSQSVRYHLGLLLAWTGQRDQAVKEFRLARTLDAADAARETSCDVPEGSRWQVGPAARKDEPSGLWRPSGAVATVPHPFRGMLGHRGGRVSKVEIVVEGADFEEEPEVDVVEAAADEEVDAARRRRGRRGRLLRGAGGRGRGDSPTSSSPPTRCSSSSRTSARSTCSPPRRRSSSRSASSAATIARSRRWSRRTCGSSSRSPSATATRACRSST